MIRIAQIKLNIDLLSSKKENKNEQGIVVDLEQKYLKESIIKILHISEKALIDFKIVKKSIDARKKQDIKYIYTVDVTIAEENKLSIHKNNANKNINVSFYEENQYKFKPEGKMKLTARPVVVGFGPSGMFCALFLAQHGYQPIVIERGAQVEDRIRDVDEFWKTNHLKPNSNVQFGEGGAGTFSDGKLNTMVKDEWGRNRKILELFVENGAPSEILYQNKPHIGTDRLREVVKSIRQKIIALGGEIRFNTTLTDLHIENNKLQSIEVNQNEMIPCESIVLAIGHSARDTFELLNHKGFDMKQKAFAIGVRIEHPQEIISRAQYGEQYSKLSPADYKLTYQASNQRSIYSFCMCPGGYVVNSSSEEGKLVVNGMSNYKRDGINANSALVVAVNPEDFGDDSPLAGVAFQRKWESLAYEVGQGKVPIQLYGDLCRNRESVTLGGIKPNIKGDYKLTNLSGCLPNYVTDTLIEGIQKFGQKIPGFASEEAILSGVETRTSSPVRIKRDESYESNILGVYPCGEGAGYAGGIMSAAIDGIKIFEAITNKYKSFV